MRGRIGCLAALVASVTVSVAVAAQTDSLVAELESLYRTELAEWSSKDIDAITSRGNALAGFGYRLEARRGVPGGLTKWSPDFLTTFFNSLEYYHANLKELHAEAYGDVVVAWGFLSEDFKHRGRRPERYTVRFSETLRRGADGTLLTILSHRDIQPFDESGRYIPRYR